MAACAAASAPTQAAPNPSAPPVRPFTSAATARHSWPGEAETTTSAVRAGSG